MCSCSSCNDFLQNTSVYACPLQHPYCETCYSVLKTVYKGSFPDGSTCAVCNVSGKFEKSSSMVEDSLETVSVEKLFNLPTNKLEALFSKSQIEVKECLRPVLKPFQCPDDECSKWMTPSLFVNHFNTEHYHLPRYSMERRNELRIDCDVNRVEYNKTRCIGLITVYEINRIGVISSNTSQNVRKACNKFAQKIPVNTFYLMESGIGNKDDALVIYWLFNSTQETYSCIIELSSRYDFRSIARFFQIHPINTKKFKNGLFLYKQSIMGLLEEGTPLNLRIIVQ